MKIRTSLAPARAVLLFAMILSPVATIHAQGAPPTPPTGPKLPAHGTITRDVARENAVLAQAKVPAGFKVTMFAGPPVAMYPTAVAASPDGSVYVGVDLNLAQGFAAGRGRIMRLVDTNGDGVADEYTTFVDVSSPRGIAVDGKTVYVMHPPNLTAYHDTNGDGVADDSTDLVKGLGFGIDVRSSDHSTNNITLAIDGWIYVAVGDYGYANAVGKDGNTIRRHGGSIVRVRTDGTGLEIYTIGTRNTYDVGIDPFMHVFARDNTNDGGGWNTRFHYLPPNAEMGYPSLFLNFGDEPMQSLFDFGAGAGTGGLWIQDPGFPTAWNNQLYTSDWTVNKVFLNPVTKRGASYSVKQQDFLEISHPVDFAMDDQSHLYVASLIGGVFNYAGDTVGAILQVSYPGRPASKALKPSTLTEAQLLTELASSNSQHRLWAQRELVTRKLTPASLQRLRGMVLNATLPAEARAAALFTWPLVAGADSHTLLKLAAKDASLREVALRALVDDKRQFADVPAALYVSALTDVNPAVRVQGINGLVRMNAEAQAASLVPLLASPDSALGHLAYRALGTLGARTEALKAIASATPATRTRARFALQLMHDTTTVNAIVANVNASPTPVVKRELLAALARLYNTDGAWNGDWWGTHPTNAGPYFAPTTWAGSTAIKPVLRASLSSAQTSDMTYLTALYAKNRVIPMGAARLLALAAPTSDKDATFDALIGSSQLAATAIPLLSELDAKPTLHGAVAELLAGETEPLPAALPIMRKAALDRALSDSVRAQLITAIAARPGAPNDAAELLAMVNPDPGATPTAVETAWRKFVGARERNAQLDYFIGVAKGTNAAQRTLAFAILIQSVRSPRVQPAVRDKVQPVLLAAWADAAAAPLLARAVRVMHLETQYADQLKAVPGL